MSADQPTPDEDQVAQDLPQTPEGARTLPTPDDIAGAPTLDALGAMWQELEDAGAHSEATNAAGNKRAAELGQVSPPAPDADTPSDEDEAAAADEPHPAQAGVTGGEGGGDADRFGVYDGTLARFRGGVYGSRKDARKAAKGMGVTDPEIRPL